MRLRTLSPALGTAYKTQQAPQCLGSILYFRSTIQEIFIKCNHVWSSFIESLLWCTTCIIRFVVMWYSIPPMYIYCHHSFHEELQKFKYLVSLKSMCFHTATYRSFLSFCDRDGRQRSIPSGPFWQIEWREYNLLFLEGLPCGKRVRPMPLSAIVLSRSCSAADTIYRLAEYCLEDPVNVNH